jgi:hypothetical protein
MPAGAAQLSAPPVVAPPVDEAAVADAQMAIEDMVARFG